MTFVTALIYGGAGPEAQWLRVSVPSFLHHCAGELLVLDNTPDCDPYGGLEWLATLPRVHISKSTRPVWRDGRRRHGDGYHGCLEWARDNGFRVMVSLEADCEVTGDTWHRRLIEAVEEGAWFASTYRCSYGPLHHFPAAYDTHVDWSRWDFNQEPKPREHLDDPRYAALVDLEAMRRMCTHLAHTEAGRENHWRWFSTTWDVGQRPWFEAALAGKAQHVHCNQRHDAGIHHYWGGSRRDPPAEFVERWQ